MAKMATLILEDGTTFKGLLFGANVSVSGEVGKSVKALLLLKFISATIASSYKNLPVYLTWLTLC